jgi:hypothetical protein
MRTPSGRKRRPIPRKTRGWSRYETRRRTSRLSRYSVASALRSALLIAECCIQMTPIVRKLVT